jgi:hypothetical protein
MDLKETQQNLPWGAHGYHRSFEEDTRPHRDFEHAVTHMGIELGALQRAVDEFAHKGTADRGAVTKALCNLLWNLLRAANTYPGANGEPIDVDLELRARFVSKFPALQQRFGVDAHGRAVDAQGRFMAASGPGCQSDDDGHCNWAGCPQLNDGEPAKSGRHCPRDARRGR